MVAATSMTTQVICLCPTNTWRTIVSRYELDKVDHLFRMGPLWDSTDQQEYDLFIATHYFLPVRKASVHFSSKPSRPYALCFANSHLWERVKSLLKVQINSINRVSLFQCFLVQHAVTTISCDLLCWKPCCSFPNELLLETKAIRRKAIIISDHHEPR